MNQQARELHPRPSIHPSQQSMSVFSVPPSTFATTLPPVRPPHQYVMQIEEAIEELMRLDTSPSCWRIVAQKNQVVISRLVQSVAAPSHEQIPSARTSDMNVESSPFHMTTEAATQQSRQVYQVRGQGVIHAPPLKVLEFVSDLSKYCLWDRMCMEARVIKDLDPSTKLVYLKYRGLFPVTPRDLCTCVAERSLPDGTLILAIFSVEHPAIPLVSGYIRAKLNPSGFIIKPFGAQCSLVSFIIQFDPNGWLPLAVANFITEYEPLRIAKIRTYVAQQMRKHYNARLCKNPEAEDQAFALHVEEEARKVNTSPSTLLKVSTRTRTNQLNVSGDYHTQEPRVHRTYEDDDEDIDASFAQYSESDNHSPVIQHKQIPANNSEEDEFVDSVSDLPTDTQQVSASEATVYLDALSKELESLKRMHEDTQRRIVSIAARVAEETERHERWIRAMSERRAAESKYGKLEEEKASLMVATSRINSLIRAISTSNRSSDSAAVWEARLHELAKKIQELEREIVTSSAAYGSKGVVRRPRTNLAISRDRRILVSDKIPGASEDVRHFIRA